MTKINFSKVEKTFDHALQQLCVNQLCELATLADVVQDPHRVNPAIQDIITRFQKELKKLKRQAPQLFDELHLSLEEENRFFLPVSVYEYEDWLLVRSLKMRIEELKHQLYGQASTQEEHEKQVHKERQRHINKRFNVKEGWLPLH